MPRGGVDITENEKPKTETQTKVRMTQQWDDVRKNSRFNNRIKTLDVAKGRR